MAIVFLDDSPTFVCVIYTLLLVCSILATILINPYSNRLFFSVRLIGDCCLVSVCMLYMCQFIPFEKQLSSEAYVASNAIPEKDVDSFLDSGWIAVYALFVFQGIYFIEFLYILIGKLYALTRKKWSNSLSVDNLTNLLIISTLLLFVSMKSISLLFNNELKVQPYLNHISYRLFSSSIRTL